MKKALSIILVLVMMFAFIPAAFAADPGVLTPITSDYCKVTVPTDWESCSWSVGTGEETHVTPANGIIEISLKNIIKSNVQYLFVSENNALRYSFPFKSSDDTALDALCSNYTIASGSSTATINGADTSMEYKVSGTDAAYTPVSTLPLVLAEGTYLFRISSSISQGTGKKTYNFPSAREVTVTVSPIPVTESKCGDNLAWTFDSSTHTLTIYGTGEMYDYNLGGSSGHIGTTAPWEPYYNSIDTVNMQEGVTSIGDYAFTGTAPTRVTIPNGVTKIGKEAFEYGKFESITIPASVETIEEDAFIWCPELKNIMVAGGNNNFRAIDGVLFDKNATKLILFPAKRTGNYIIPSTVTAIEKYAFCLSDLTSVTIPDGITNIGEGAFDSSSIKSAVIPEGVTTIPAYTFTYCNELEMVTIPASVTSIGRSAFNIYGSYPSSPKLKEIYFNGTEDQWKKIQIHKEGNEILSTVTIHYDTPVDPTITSVVITDPTTEAFSLGSVGELAVFKASVNPEKSPDGKQNKINWTSSNTNVVSVYSNEYGTEAYIYATGAGSATVSASCGEKRDTVTVYVISDYKFTYPTGKLVFYYDNRSKIDCNFATTIPADMVTKVTVNGYTLTWNKDSNGNLSIPYSSLLNTFGTKSARMPLRVYYGEGSNQYIEKTLYYMSIYDAPLTADTDMTWAYVTMLVSGLFISASPWVAKRAKRRGASQ